MCVIVLFQYALTVYFTPLMSLIRVLLLSVISNPPNIDGWEDIVWYANFLKNFVIEFVTETVPDIIDDASLELPVSLSDDDALPLIAIPHISTLLNLVPSITRLGIIAMFLCSFGTEMFRKPITTIWLRVIESEKPVFTLLCTGIGAIATIVQAIVK
jgi:hypothetical protein